MLNSNFCMCNAKFFVCKLKMVRGFLQSTLLCLLLPQSLNHMNFTNTYSMKPFHVWPTYSIWHISRIIAVLYVEFVISQCIVPYDVSILYLLCFHSSNIYFYHVYKLIWVTLEHRPSVLFWVYIFKTSIKEAVA